MAQLLVSLVFIACVSSCYATYYTYKYMDDSDVCWGSMEFLESSSNGMKVSAWSPGSGSKNPLWGGCELTIGAYGIDKMKFKFSSDSYISSADVTLNVYDGFTTYDNQLGNYSSGNSFTTHYTYTHGDYITIKLNNPSQSTDFSFTIQIENYDDITHYFTIGDIIGSIIGSAVLLLALILTLVGLCIRRRRIVARAALIRAEAPVAQVATSAQINYPAPPTPYTTGQAPYPAGNVKYPTTGAGYPAATTAYPPP